MENLQSSVLWIYPGLGGPFCVTELLRACVRVFVQKVPILHIFNTPFLPAVESLGYQTLRSLGACRMLPKCGQLVPVLRQVRAWGTSECPVFQHGFLENAASHGYDGFISLCMFTPNRRRSVGMARFGENDRRRSSKTEDDRTLPLLTNPPLWMSP